MRFSSRLSIGIHSLFIINNMRDVKVTSEMIAEYTGNNPVNIRKILGSLKRAGFIEISKGKKADTVLIKSLDDITLWDVFCAVEGIDEINILNNICNPLNPYPEGEPVRHAFRGEIEKVILAGKNKMQLCTVGMLMNNMK